MNLNLYSDVFIDKLGERIAFEKTGTGLYEALLSKYSDCDNQSILPPKEKVEQFFLEEKKHFEIACEVMKDIGGDPDSLPPGSTLAAVAGAGWVQTIKDPDTNFLQGLDVILKAELVNNTCWNSLIELAERLSMNEYAEQFKTALEEKDVHLVYVSSWLKQLNVHGKVLDVQKNFAYKLLASAEAKLY